jgi:outer membrane protein
MKSIVIKIASLISIIAFVSCTKKETTPSPNVEGTATVHPKIVFVNIDTFLSKYNLYLEKKGDLEKEYAAAEKSIAAKIEAFQNRLAKFQQEAYEIQKKAPTIAPVELKKIQEEFSNREQALASEESALVKQRDGATQDLEKKITELQNKLKKNIDDYLAKIAKERAYDYVLSKGVGQSVLFGNTALDITEETIKAMNEDYSNTKSAK